MIWRGSIRESRWIGRMICWCRGVGYIILVKCGNGRGSAGFPFHWWIRTSISSCQAWKTVQMCRLQALQLLGRLLSLYIVVKRVFLVIRVIIRHVSSKMSSSNDNMRYSVWLRRTCDISWSITTNTVRSMTWLLLCGVDIAWGKSKPAFFGLETRSSGRCRRTRTEETPLEGHFTPKLKNKW